MTIDQMTLRRGLEQEAADLRAVISDELNKDQQDPRTTAMLDLRRSELRKVELALLRHADGTWNKCAECATDISDELARLGTALHCTSCATGHVHWGDTGVIDLSGLDLS